ncbi:exodeoxyribonuclease VII large subunit [Treponema sp.]|uniref:exodeoxyribonuclease VII large subunit n=1 Tax=Treponema sp. TaxID=166 RepID=UPI00298E72D0|nr:exodeoxyribonuclease VII large subunit [Treponema sp.]MCQ2241833.1 exodeoxyribonuclease VII large subunit [Treponema sp.]
MEDMFAERKDNSLTVTQLTNLIKTMLENSFQNILLKGEISNFKPSSSGHLYFSLKDADAQISAVMFRGSAMGLNFQPKDGTMVQVRGKLSVYAPRGNYQLIITSMEKAGSGNIMEMIELRKRKLAAEGLFDSSRKRRLPLIPETVGIVTSPNGAALRDILNIRKRRNDKVNIIVFPALVQGETAAPTIVKMIETANIHKMCDVLIVGRGGGSLEDLLPFSEESVVRAIAASEIPVVSAVGHEIDWALSDFAADCRAPTPSAAAEIVIPEKAVILNNIAMHKNNLYSSISERTRSLRLLLKSFDPENMHTRLMNIEQRLSERFDRAYESMKNSMSELIKEKKRLIAHSREILESCNPQSIFDRGYSMVTDKNGNVVRDAKVLKSGEQIKIRPAKGEVTATVD